VGVRYVRHAGAASGDGCAAGGYDETVPLGQRFARPERGSTALREGNGLVKLRDRASG